MVELGKAVAGEESKTHRHQPESQEPERGLFGLLRFCEPKVKTTVFEAG